jgi:hypothetical protein
MTKNNEQQNLMEVYPCQLKNLNLSCYGCCRNGVSSKSQIKLDLKENNIDFKKYFLDKKMSVDNLKKFRNRYSIKETLSSGVCRNLVDFERGCVACPLHPFVNSIVDKSKTIAPKEDLRVGFCDTKFECDTLKFWSTMNLVQRKQFIRFLESKKLNNHEYSMSNIDGNLIQEYFRREFEFEEFCE